MFGPSAAAEPGAMQQGFERKRPAECAAQEAFWREPREAVGTSVVVSIKPGIGRIFRKDLPQTSSQSERQEHAHQRETGTVEQAADLDGEYKRGHQRPNENRANTNYPHQTDLLLPSGRGTAEGALSIRPVLGACRIKS